MVGYRDALPSVLRLISPPVFRLYGIDIWGKKRFLDETMAWDPQKRERWRLDRLNSLLEFCWKYSPFYREFWADHGLRFKPLGAIEELSTYPVIDKLVFRANLSRIKPTCIDKIPHKSHSTGGTTGVPMPYCQDLELEALRGAFVQWGWGLAGYCFGDPLVSIWASALSVDPSQRHVPLKRQLRGFLSNSIRLAGIRFNEEIARDYAEKMMKHRAKYLYGFPSMINEFACLLEAMELNPKLEAVISTGEMLLPQYSKNIERIFGCQVLNEFGCNDGGVLSYECSLRQGFHYNDIESILEVSDAAGSDTGMFMITNLWNMSSPFIRYQNGDRVCLQDSSCSCGIPFPVIREVVGRTGDLLTFSNGRSITGVGFLQFFEEIPDINEIDGYQIVQRATDKLEIRVLAPRGLGESNQMFIRKVVRHHLGSEIALDIQVVPTLERTARGKLRTVFAEFQ